MRDKAFASIRPIFEEEAKYLTKKLKIDIPKESCFMENNIVKAFTSKDKLVKLFRIEINKELTDIRLLKVYEKSHNKLLNWKEVIELYNNDLLEYENESINIISKFLYQYKDYEPILLVSGGKDSTLLIYITRKVNPNIKAYYNNTSNEVAEHYTFIKTIPNLEIINPKEGLWQYCKRENFIPSAISRACCRIYKHEATVGTLDKAKKYLLFMGMRNIESKKRENYGDIHRMSYYPHNWIGVLPIRKWDSLKVWLYLIKNNIEINPIYRKGYSRCGCIICPFRKSYEEVLTKEYYSWYSNRFKKMLEANFVSNKRWIYLNCTKKEFLDYAWKGGKIRDKPTEQVIEEFSMYMDLDKNITQKYFNKSCYNHEIHTETKKLNDLEVALNLKLIGRNTTKLMCIDCLAKYLLRIEIKDLETYSNNKKSLLIKEKKKALRHMAREFKDSGCSLF